METTFLNLNNLCRVEGLVTTFSSSIKIDGVIQQSTCHAGGNSIYARTGEKGIRFCFASRQQEPQYLNKIRLIAKIVPQYVPTVYDTGTATVSFSKDFQKVFMDFVESQNLPDWLVDKYELMRTIKSTVDIPYLTLEHLVSFTRVDPLHTRINIDDLRFIANASLDAGIYMGYVPRVSNIISTRDGIKYLDFDEWVIVDQEQFTKSLVKYGLL